MPRLNGYNTKRAGAKNNTGTAPSHWMNKARTDLKTVNWQALN